MEKLRLPFIILLLTACFGSVFLKTVRAQQNTEAGRIELGAHASGAFDLYGPRPTVGLFTPTGLVVNDAGERKIQPAFGGSALVSLHKQVWAYGTVNLYLPEERTAHATSGNISVQKTRERRYTTAFGGLQFTYGTVTRVVPYLNVGAGVLHYNQTETQTTQNIVGLQPQQTEESTLTTAALHYGGGIRFFVSENWGFRGGVDGFYTRDALRQPFLFVNQSSIALPEQTRHGFGQLTAGFFKQWR